MTAKSHMVTFSLPSSVEVEVLEAADGRKAVTLATELGGVTRALASDVAVSLLGAAGWIMERLSR